MLYGVGTLSDGKKEVEEEWGYNSYIAISIDFHLKWFANQLNTNLHIHKR